MPSAPDSSAARAIQRRFWRANLRLVLVLLLLWALAGLGCGVLWADALNQAAHLGGFPLGFWFAQQGSILVFVALVLVYAVLAARLDARLRADLRALDAADVGDAQ